MSYAIIATGGKQYRVAVGDRIRVELLPTDVGEAVTFQNVLAVKTGDEMRIGRPTLEGASVVGRVLTHAKAKKVLVFKKKRRKQYRRTRGHRQNYTSIVVEEINAG